MATYTPVEGNPFEAKPAAKGPTYTPVEGNPFAAKAKGPTYTPVDYNPFDVTSKGPSSTSAQSPGGAPPAVTPPPGGSFKLSFANGKPELMPGETPLAKAPPPSDPHSIAQGLPAFSGGAVWQGFDEAVAGGMQMMQEGNQDPSYFGRAKQVGGLLGMATAPFAGLAHGVGDFFSQAGATPQIAQRVEDVAGGLAIPGVPKGLRAERAAIKAPALADRIEPTMAPKPMKPPYEEPAVQPRDRGPVEQAEAFPQPAKGPTYTPVEGNPFEQKASAPEAAPDDFSSWKQVGPQKGSNAGGVYQDATGDTHYVKTPKTADHVANETLTNKLYKSLKVPVPDVQAGTMGGKPVVASKMLDGLEPFDKNNPVHVRAVQNNFASHAFLGNWDAVGLDLDNQLYGNKGMVTIDGGGGLKYRAQGAAKPSFTGDVGEWETMRDPSYGPGAKVFSTMTPEDLAKSAKPVLALTDDAIRDAVKSVGYPDSFADTLIKRREAIRAKVEDLKPKTADQWLKSPVTEDPFDKISEAVKPKAAKPKAPAKLKEGTVPEGTSHLKITWSTSEKILDFQKQLEAKHAIPTKLPTDHGARMKRAAKLGFDTTKEFFHGTKNLFHSFDTGKVNKNEQAIFLTDKPDIAHSYGSKGILPLLARIENPMTVDWHGGHYSSEKMSALLKEAEAKGHDVLINKNMNDIGGNQTQWAFLKPENLRAKYANFDPAMKKSAHMLSSDVDVGPKDLPERPADKFIEGTDDSLFRLRQAATADKAELREKFEALPAELKNRENDEQLYALQENDPEAKVAPDLRDLYEEHLGGIKQEENDLYNELRTEGLAEGDIDPDGHIHRMAKGKTPEIDRLAGEGGDDFNPTGGRSLSQKAPSQRKRKFFALEDEAGNRKTVAINDAGQVQVMNKTQPVTLQNVKIATGSGIDDVKPGAKISVGGKEWTIKQSYTRELERDTNTRYYKSAIANRMRNIMRLRATARAVAELKRLQATPEWAKYTTGHNDPAAPTNYRVPDMPLFRDYKMDPKIAEVIDDFYGRVRNGDDNIAAGFEKVNRFVTQSLFWTPIPHIHNTGWHWFSSRGIDNFTLPGMGRLLKTAPDAIREVIRQGPRYQEMLRQGSGLVYGGIANRGFYEGILKGLGHSIEAEPSKWGPIAKLVGGPKELVAMIYNGSSKALWSVSDMLMMQRVMELEMKGKSTRAAIAGAEKHIPNYRVPTRIFNSRGLQKTLTNPYVMQFSRYHYGMFKSWAHVGNDMLKAAKGDKEAAKEAIGHLIATGFLMAIIEPLMSYGVQKLTGNKDASVGAAGSTTLPRMLWDVTMGDKSLAEAVSSTITLNPLVKEAGQQMFNKDFFSGRNIAEPGERSVGRKIAQRAGHAAGVIAPFGAANEAWKNHKNHKNHKNPAGIIAEKGLGYKDPSLEQTMGKKKGLHHQKAQARSHANKPRNMIESLF